jgi:hypothetical protein
MEPYEIKENIRIKTEQYNSLKQEIIDLITSFTDYLNRISMTKLPRYICADAQPFTLELTQIKPFKIILDTTDGTKVILEDGQTIFPIKNLPLEDLIQLYKRLYYQ